MTHERDVPLQLQPGAQAYIGPEHMLKVPVKPMSERLVEISHCLSNHLRGVQEQRRKPSPKFNDDGSKDWKALIRHLKDEVANLQEFEVLLCIRNNDDRRFKLRLCYLAEWKVLPGKVCRGSRLRSRLRRGTKTGSSRESAIERFAKRFTLSTTILASTSWTGGTILDSTRTQRPRTPTLPFLGLRTIPRIFVDAATLSKTDLSLEAFPGRRGAGITILRLPRHASQTRESSREREPVSQCTSPSTLN